jgi:hypothetical protein
VLRQRFPQSYPEVAPRLFFHCASSGWAAAWPRARTGVSDCAGFAPNEPQPRSSSRAGLLPPSPLRTVRESFPSHGSSLSNASDETREQHEHRRRWTAHNTPRRSTASSRGRTSHLKKAPRAEHDCAPRSTTATRGHRDERPCGPSRVSEWAHTQHGRATPVEAVHPPRWLGRRTTMNGLGADQSTCA